MHDEGSGGAITVDGERLERLLDVVSLATAGAFVEAMSRLERVEQDRLGFIEEALRLFLGELEAAREQREQALEEIRVANQELEQKLAMIERQALAIEQLSTPIIDIWDDVLTLPVVGLMDASRATDMAEKLLHRVVEVRARWVLVDLTGVHTVDLGTADHLLRLARSVRMIGSRCIVTGISPDVALAFVQIGVGLEDLTPMRSLRDGLKHCLAERAKARGAPEQDR